MSATPLGTALAALPQSASVVEVASCTWTDTGFDRTARLRTMRRLDLSVLVHPLPGPSPEVRLSWYEPADGQNHLDLPAEAASELAELLLEAAARAGRGEATTFAESRTRLVGGVTAGILFAPPDPVVVVRLLVGPAGTGRRQLLLLPEEAKGLGARLAQAAVRATGTGEAA